MLKRSIPTQLPRAAPTIANGARVVFQPVVLDALCDGSNTVVDLLKPTLGPLSRSVLIERNAGRHFAPDIVDDGGIIARRLIELPDPNVNVGAMLLRNALWGLHERAGDSVASAAVMFQEIVRHARPFIAAGGTVMQLRTGLLHAAETACGALDAQASALDGDVASLRRWVSAHCIDASLSSHIASALSTYGADVAFRVENGQSADVQAEFIAGAFWIGGWQASPLTANEGGQNLMLRLPEAHVLVSDLALSNPGYMEPLIMALTRLKPKRLVVICASVSPQLLTLFVQARQKAIGDVVFVKVPALSGPDRLAVLLDMALLTGATVIPSMPVSSNTATEVDLASLLPHCLGQADAIWASDQFVGVEGGRGDRAAQIAHLRGLDDSLWREQDPARIRFIQERMNSFGAGVVRLKVGAHTDSDQKQRRALAERAVRLATQASRFGVVPGVGRALLNCEAAVRASSQALCGDAAHGPLCVAHALSAPMWWIAQNAGIDPGAFIRRNRDCKPGWGVDVRRNVPVDLAANGLMDSLFALKLAVRTAASAAATLLTTDVIVHRRQHEAALRP